MRHFDGSGIKWGFYVFCPVSLPWKSKINKVHHLLRAFLGNTLNRNLCQQCIRGGRNHLEYRHTISTTPPPHPLFLL